MLNDNDMSIFELIFHLLPLMDFTTHEWLHQSGYSHDSDYVACRAATSRGDPTMRQSRPHAEAHRQRVSGDTDDRAPLTPLFPMFSTSFRMSQSLSNSTLHVSIEASGGVASFPWLMYKVTTLRIWQ